MDNTALFFSIFNLSHKYPILDTLMIFGAEYLIFTVAVVGIILGLKNKLIKKQELLISISAVIFAITVVKILNLFFYIPRPFIQFPIQALTQGPFSSSFPSLHTSIAFSIAFIFLFMKSKLAPIFILSAIWIGFARIYTGVHFPLDILGGILIGGLCASLIYLFAKPLNGKNIGSGSK